MKKKMTGITGVILAVFAAFLLLYLRFRADWMYSCAITFGTVSYHFLMRFAVGGVINSIMQNRTDLSNAWYQPRKWEPALYQKLRVKQWKKHIPTFLPDNFSPDKHSWNEIAQAMCQAEIVHEVIVIFSFVPLLFAIPFGAFPVFLLTSLGAALLDTVFVIVQRYNRPRIMKLATIQTKKKKGTNNG